MPDINPGTPLRKAPTLLKNGPTTSPTLVKKALTSLAHDFLSASSLPGLSPIFGPKPRRSEIVFHKVVVKPEIVFIIGPRTSLTLSYISFILAARVCLLGSARAFSSVIPNRSLIVFNNTPPARKIKLTIGPKTAPTPPNTLFKIVENFSLFENVAIASPSFPKNGRIPSAAGPNDLDRTAPMPFATDETMSMPILRTAKNPLKIDLILSSLDTPSPESLCSHKNILRIASRKEVVILVKLAPFSSA